MPPRRERRKTGRLLIICVLIIAVIAAWQYFGRWGRTPSFRDASGNRIANSIAEMHRITLGGAQQSVTIRGRDARAPILIWLHGGPGQDETGLWRRYNSELEAHFVVVYWTQRGTGRSYSRDIPSASMTIAQFVSDLHELVGYLQQRFGRQRVVLAGHSWGTSFGVAYTQAHPETVAAFVGVSQVVNATAGERLSYRFTIDEARRRGDTEAQRELLALGEPPYPMSSIVKQRRWLDRFGGGAFHQPTSLITLMWQSFGASELTLLDGLYFQTGVDFSQNSLAAENARVDWWRLARRFDMPIFIATGIFDRNTDARLQKAYFDRIEAPVKMHRWFRHSAHSPLFEEADAFNQFMIETVLPVAQQWRTRGG